MLDPQKQAQQRLKSNERERVERSSSDLAIRAKWLAKDARKRAAIKADPSRQARWRELARESKRRKRSSEEGLERHRGSGRKATRRLRMLNPEYAAQWSRDPKGRWFRAAQSADGTVTRELLAIIEADVLCPYCLVVLTDDNRVFDHVEPIARGGKHAGDNLAACCSSCNGSKGKLSLIQFLGRRRDTERDGVR